MEAREICSVVFGSDDPHSDDRNEIWTPTSPTSTPASSLLPSPHEVPKLEALLYYPVRWHWYATTLALARTATVPSLFIERRGQIRYASWAGGLQASDEAYLC